ncbi:MAG: DUF4038 domain-containing protein [Eubacterium sp.]|nr:DUF4038 domain-containing protein [Eubacterium sp.]
MGRLKVGENKCSFTLDNKPFFYLADTIWSAFTNVTMEEWRYYLKTRKAQGFTVLQINTLPQWDRCMTDVGVYPFATEDGQKMDFSRWEKDYYDRARQMCRMAKEEGFQLALVVLWLNYVPGTWGSRMTDINVMPEEMVEEYTEKVVREFEEFEPIYVVSGDTDFDTEEAVRYYEKALSVLCEKSPDSLKTMHIKRGYDYIPEQFAKRLDFFMFQSGHNVDGQDMAWILPERFRKKYPGKPVINAEPCYEQMGYSRKKYGRFEARDIRKAAWSSLLSGACAGVTYGAHGIWNWKKTGCLANPILGEGFDEPQSWENAIQFPGAWDYGMIPRMFEMYGIDKLLPCNELLEEADSEIRMAEGNGIYLIYLPYNTKLCIRKELKHYVCQALDLSKKRVASLDMEIRDGVTLTEMHPFLEDVLLILREK